ncbi:LysR substrate-binding domain-containing protein [Roseovarius aestuariivivens]|uniref:LysR substrate-binding domain-containing protein n=1 Tax=Roseovarius aestuariivivens TaxID=1888910 RepID=UPI001080AA48|nr:LysR substrate-binding domain-containing protein [Roseovarius aestuariivivens]
MRLSHLNALKALEATLRLGSFTKAAEELGVTPAAVGQQVRALEARVDTALFDRGKTGVEATHAAQRVRERLSFHMAGLADVLADLQDATDEARLSLTLPASFAENWFTRRLPAFWQAHRDIDLRLNASNRMIDLQKEAFDFALRFCGPQGGEVDTVDLFGDFVLPVCTPRLAQRHGLASDRVTLDGVPLVHLDDRTPDDRWADWPKWASAFGVSTANAGGDLRYQEVNSGLSAARLEQGLVLAGLVEAHDALLGGELVAPFGLSRSCPTSFRYRLVWPARTRRSAVQEGFIDWLTEEAARFRASVDQLFEADDRDASRA